MADAPLSERVDDQFRAVGLPLHDVNGMMRHILDCLGALKVRLSEELESKALINVFGGAVTTIVNHITEDDLIDSQSGVNLLLDTFPDDMKRKDGRSWLPLHWAAALHDTAPSDFLDIIHMRPFNCIKGHLHPNKIGEFEAGDTYRGLLPLHFCVSVQHPSIQNVRALIESHPNTPSLPDHRGWLPLHWCAYNCRNTDIATLLLKRFRDGPFTANKRGKLPFQLSAYNRYTEIMDLMFRANPEAVDGLDYNGNTPLHDAVKSFNPEGVEKLFTLKYDLGRVRNFKEQLPIHKGFSHIPEGSTRLHSRQLQTMNALLRMNPETASLPDLNDSLPLHLAVFHNSSLEVVQTIYNVFPSAALVKDNTGRLPVHYVSNQEVKKLLLKASAPLSRAGITDSFSRFVT